MVLSEPVTRREAPVTAVPGASVARPAVAAHGRRYLESGEPWTPRSVRLALVLGALAALAAGLCWYGGSDKREVEDQVPWLLGSLLAVAFFALVGAVWLIAAFRTLRQGMRDLAADKRAFALGGRPVAGRVAASGASAHAGLPHSGLVVGAGMVRAHRPDCPLVQGKAVREVELTDRSLGACGVCLP
jgi:hypothetical protein